MLVELLEQNNKTLGSLLLALEGAGAIFVGIFLAAYLGGMFMNPSTTVLHSDLAFKIPLMIFGAVILVLALAITVFAAFRKR